MYFRLSPELSGMIADEMDIASLICWRQTCIANYAHAVASLERKLVGLVDTFLSYPTALLQVVTDFNAVIGGEVALAYIRRDVLVRPHSLEIFVSRLEYEAICRSILSDPLLSLDIVDATTVKADYTVCTQRDITQTLRLRLRSGLDMHVRRSSTLSPLSPIARAPCTALMNFVTRESFGCAYPRLTLNNQALLCDLGMDAADYLDGAARNVLVDVGIDAAVEPSHWPEYRVWSPTPSNVDTVNACWRSHFICPEQGRFFGDRGSFVDFVSPLDCGAVELRDRRAPPFGCTIVWRLSSSYQCVMSCEGRDRLLPNGVTSQAVIFVHDRFSTATVGCSRRSRSLRIERSGTSRIVRQIGRAHV